MKVTLFCLAFVILAIVCADNPLTASISKFSTGFYNAIISVLSNQSIICSPLSAHIILSLLMLATKGVSQTELSTALSVPNPTFIETNYRSYIDTLTSIQGITLNSANKIYVMTGFSLNSNFQQKAENIFLAAVESIAFQNSVQAASTISSWVETKTNGKIKNAVIPAMINADTRVFLVNAIYFLGTWKDTFDPDKTIKLDFNLSKMKKVQIDMMQQVGSYKNVNLPNLNAKAIEIPYKGEMASLVIVLPNDIEGLSALEKKVSGLDLKSAIFNQLEGQFSRVALYLPKFKIETTMDLKLILPKMGIKSIFDPALADLSGLLNSAGKLYVSVGIQKAIIEVNELGTEAAAVTIIGSSATSAPPEFLINHPFMFFVKTNSGDVLFSGNYRGSQTVSPTKPSVVYATASASAFAGPIRKRSYPFSYKFW